MSARRAAEGVTALAMVAVSLCFASSHASAQTLAIPSAHWGSLAYPERAQQQRIGVDFVLFSEFGKNVDTDGLPAEADMGERDPYNWQTETVGFNLLSLSNTRPLRSGGGRSRDSNMLYTSTLFGGYTANQPTEWFQNEVIHKPQDLEPIPRGDVRACEKGKQLRCLQIGYSGELNYWFDSLERLNGGYHFLPSPLFAGGGFALSTIQNEAYSQLGIRRALIPLFPQPWRSWVYLTGSVMSRTGVLLPSLTFGELSSYYVTAQGSLALHFAAYVFPVDVEFGLSGTTGQFVLEKRPEGNQSVPPSEALRELTYALRLGLGDWTFETFNDSPGGKDKGPSYGVRILYTTSPDETISFLTGWL